METEKDRIIENLKEEIEKKDIQIQTLKNELIEKTRFASSLNKFVFENCTKKQTFGNIDLVSYKIENGTEKFIIIEYKELYEDFGKMQEKWLQLLSKYIPVYVVKGSDNFDYCYIKSIQDKNYKTIHKEELIKFLEFKIDYKDIKI